MSQQTIGIGTVANDGTGDPLRTAFNKANSNFTELYNGLGGVIAKSGTAAALTGTVSETVIATIPIPANTLGANGVLRITTLWSLTNSANSKTWKLRFGSSGLSGTVVATATVSTIAAMRIETTIMAANATNAQNSLSIYPRGTDYLTTEAANTTSAVDMTAAQNVVITGTLANIGETLTLLGYIVEAIQ